MSDPEFDRVLQTIPEEHRGLFTYVHRDEPETFLQRHPSKPDYNRDSGHIRMRNVDVVQGYRVIFNGDDTNWMITESLETQLQHSLWLKLNSGFGMFTKSFAIERCKILKWNEETNG